MGPTAPFAVDIDRISLLGEPLMGGKAATVGSLRQAGLRIPDGFCITTHAYRRFVSHNGLEPLISLELGRKPLEGMRWEELWDAALRIRSAFLKAPFPTDMADVISEFHEALGREKTLVVRSSAPGEDSASASFAGIHESVLDVIGRDSLFRAVRSVWASLWSDAALLYRRELSLNPLTSSMAVLVQEFVESDVSGVAFSRDPLDTSAQTAVVEAVPGRCSDLVDGLIDPERWVLSRVDGEVLTRSVGKDELEANTRKLLLEKDLKMIWRILLRIESLIGNAVDLEWTGRNNGYTVLQARPISTVARDNDETRSWYLSLRPAAKRLKALSERVAGILIPELEALGHRFNEECLTDRHDNTLADALTERLEAVEHWRKVYWDEFIPFAHGVRQLAQYYNDRVCPDDPYEFVGLLKGENLLALERNQRFEQLAMTLKANPELFQATRTYTKDLAEERRYQGFLTQARTLPGGKQFVSALEKLLEEAMNVSYGSHRLASHPEHLLHHLIELAQLPTGQRSLEVHSKASSRMELENRLFSGVGTENRAEAEEILAIGRLSWRLRDDDNILLARLESQLLKAMDIALKRLSDSGRLEDSSGIAKEEDIAIVAAALRDPQHPPILLSREKKVKSNDLGNRRKEKPRQLLGQPAAPGTTTGLVRIIEDVDDLPNFKAGEVLVCRAIEPTMTHLVPLARAIIESRGGMLIHGAIIARELGIPCVNGIAGVLHLLKSGDLVTVDGFLGIVTVGAPEFDLEQVTLGS